MERLPPPSDSPYFPSPGTVKLRVQAIESQEKERFGVQVVRTDNANRTPRPRSLSSTHAKIPLASVISPKGSTRLLPLNLSNDMFLLEEGDERDVIFTPRKKSQSTPNVNRGSGRFKAHKKQVIDELKPTLKQTTKMLPHLPLEQHRYQILHAWLWGCDEWDRQIVEDILKPIKGRLTSLLGEVFNLPRAGVGDYQEWTDKLKLTLLNMCNSCTCVKTFLTAFDEIESINARALILEAMGGDKTLAYLTKLSKKSSKSLENIKIIARVAEYGWPAGEVEEHDVEKVKNGDLESSALRSLVKGGHCQVQKVTFVNRQSKEEFVFQDEHDSLEADNRSDADKEREIVRRWLEQLNRSGYLETSLDGQALDVLSQRVCAGEETEVSSVLRATGVGGQSAGANLIRKRLGSLIRKRIDAHNIDRYKLFNPKGKIAPRVEVIGPRNFEVFFTQESEILCYEGEVSSVCARVHSVWALRWNENLDNLSGSLRVGLLFDKTVKKDDRRKIKEIWAKLADSKAFLAERLKWPEFQDRPPSSNLSPGSQGESTVISSDAQ